MQNTFDSMEWLRANGSLRMDANDAMFPEERRQFHLARYEFALAHCRGKRVLDGACGTGYGSALIGSVAESVVGIDCAPDAIAYASATYAAPNVSFRTSFVESTPFPDNTFDVVLSFETVEHTLCPRAHLMEVARLLDPSGVAIVSVPNAWGLTDHHFVDFNLDLLQDVARPFFGDMAFFYQNSASHARFPGIGQLASASPQDAQCIIGVLEAPEKRSIVRKRDEAVMSEIYDLAFRRHADYLTLAYRANTGPVRRLQNKLKTMLARSHG
jgi:ubiquinone/menaquinone biosynthesis C-methylase UbiE